MLLSSNSKKEPWLYEELHRTTSMTNILKRIFKLEGKVPKFRGATKAFDGIHFFLYMFVHQSQYIIGLADDNKLPDAALATWDLFEEAIYEILAACLLTRLRTIPQSLVHVRRALELAIESAFISTSYINQKGTPWSPFADLYISNLWQDYSRSQPLSFREVANRIKEQGKSVSEGLCDFTQLYLESFAGHYCESHFNQIRSQVREEVVNYSIQAQNEYPKILCKHSGCSKGATIIVADRVPSFELMREVVKAKLKPDGYSKAMDRTAREIYAKTSAFVHVTRQAHKHTPGWSTSELDKWKDIIRLFLPWAAQLYMILCTKQGISLPGLPEYLASINYRFFGPQPRKIEEPICSLFLGKENGSESR